MKNILMSIDYLNIFLNLQNIILNKLDKHTLFIITTGIMVFLARLVDVSLGTLKLKALMRGKKDITFIIAFFEVLVYMLAVSSALKYIDNKFILLLYCLGYASGNYLGIIIDEKISNSNLFILIISDHDEETIQLADYLRKLGYGVTTDKGYGLNGNPKLQLKIIVEKKKFEEIKKIIDEYNINKNLFFSVMEVKEIQKINSKV